MRDIFRLKDFRLNTLVFNALHVMKLNVVVMHEFIPTNCLEDLCPTSGGDISKFVARVRFLSGFQFWNLVKQSKVYPNQVYFIGVG